MTMSAEMKIGLFDRLAMRDWYKYLLYISGIMLVLATFLDTKIQQSKVIDFSMWTIGISLLTWFSDRAVTAAYDYYVIQRARDQPIREEEKGIAILNLFVQGILLTIWLIAIAPKLF